MTCSVTCRKANQNLIKRRYKKTDKGRQSTKKYEASKAYLEKCRIKASTEESKSRKKARILAKISDGDPKYKAILDLYSQGKGFRAIAKVLHCAPSTAQAVVSAAGMQDSTRANVKGSSVRGPNKSRLPKLCFTPGQKNRIFIRDKGICQYCKSPVYGTKWCIHHVIPVSRDPSKARDESNGVLLHQKCHQDNFEELHGFSKPENYLLAENKE